MELRKIEVLVSDGKDAALELSNELMALKQLFQSGANDLEDFLDISGYLGVGRLIGRISDDVRQLFNVIYHEIRQEQASSLQMPEGQND